MESSWDDYISESTATTRGMARSPKSPLSPKSSKSKVSSLLEFLDNAGGKRASSSSVGEDSDHNRGTHPQSPQRMRDEYSSKADSSLDDIEDDVSALSFSMSKDSRLTSTKRGGYIWDDWVDEVGRGDSSGVGHGLHTESSTGTREEPTYFSMMPSSSRVHGGDGPLSAYTSGASRGVLSNDTENTLETTIFELKEKLSAMKKEAKAKGLRAKQLQGEYTRLSTAKNRKILRSQTKWEERLREEKEQHHMILSKQKDFLGKVSKDVSDLETKMADMQRKLDTSSLKGKKELQVTKQEMAKSLSRARKQWELNEGAHFRKLLAEKNDQLQQEVTDSFEPRLAKFVEKGRTELRSKSADLEKKMQKLKRQLQSEMHGKLDEAVEELREELKVEEQRMRMGGERDLQACLTRHNDEINALRDRYSRERRLTEEGAEKIRRLEAESTLDGLKTIRKAEQGKVHELTARQAREMSDFVSQSSAQRDEYRRRLETELTQWRDGFGSRLESEMQAKADRLRGLAKATSFAEGEEVIRKVKEDLRIQQEELKDDTEARLMAARVHHETALKRLKTDTERDLNDIDMLESDLRRLRMERDVGRRDEEARSGREASASRRIDNLRSELQAVQNELQEIGLHHQRDAERRMDMLREELREWKDSFMDAREAAEASSKRGSAAVAGLKERLAGEFTRITDKVTAVIKSKDLVVRDLQRQLSELQRSNAMYQDELELRRDQKFSSLA